MTDWKMPEWMREIVKYYGLYGAYIEAIETCNNSELQVEPQAGGFTYLVSWLNDLRRERLLLTPTERDENNKRIAELEAEVELQKKGKTAWKTLALETEAEVERLKSKLRCKTFIPEEAHDEVK